MLEKKVYYSIVGSISEDCPVEAAVTSNYQNGIFYGHSLVELPNKSYWKSLESGRHIWGYFTTEEAAMKILKVLKMDSQVIAGLIKVGIRKCLSSDLSLYNTKILVNHFYMFTCSDTTFLFKPMTIQETIDFLQS